MRIALQISGQLRTFRATRTNLMSELRDRYRADVFVHTWNEVGLPQTAEGHSESKTVTADDIAHFYGATRVKVEDWSPSYVNHLRGVTRSQDLRLYDDAGSRGTLPMYYGIHQVNQLRVEHEAATGTAYDIIIRTRPDIRIENLDFEPRRHARQPFLATVGPTWKFGRRYIWDPFFVADKETMLRIAKLWELMPQFMEMSLGPNRLGVTDRGYQMAGSRLLSRALDSYPTSQIVRLKARVAILRADGRLDLPVAIPVWRQRLSWLVR